MTTPTRWQRVPIGTQERTYLESATVHGTGRKAIKLWSRSPFFISRLRGGPARYSLHATGMDCSGSAATLGWHEKIADAKAQAIILAALDAPAVEFWTHGDVRFERGTQVSFKTSSFPLERRLGTVETIRDGGLAMVRWLGRNEPVPQLLTMLCLHSFTIPSPPEPETAP